MVDGLLEASHWGIGCLEAITRLIFCRLVRQWSIVESRQFASGGR